MDHINKEIDIILLECQNSYNSRAKHKYVYEFSCSPYIYIRLYYITLI